MIDDWGWNPSTVRVIISSVVGLLTLALILFVYRDAEASRRSAKAAQASADVLVKEAESRTRPWLGFPIANLHHPTKGMTRQKRI